LCQQAIQILIIPHKTSNKDSKYQKKDSKEINRIFDRVLFFDSLSFALQLGVLSLREKDSEERQRKRQQK